MCKFASFVLTKYGEFYLHTSDSHTDIICHYGLVEMAPNGIDPNILRIEIIPSFGNSLDDWEYRIDQDIKPTWHDPEKDEKRARAALKRRAEEYEPMWEKIKQENIALNLKELDRERKSIYEQRLEQVPIEIAMRQKDTDRIINLIAQNGFGIEEAPVEVPIAVNFTNTITMPDGRVMWKSLMNKYFNPRHFNCSRYLI